MGEPKLKDSKGFKDNYGRFMVYGAMYGVHWLHTWVLLIHLGIHTFFLGYTIFLASEELKVMGEAAHFTVFRILAFVVIWNGWLRKHQITFLFNHLGDRRVHNYENTLSKSCQSKMEQAEEECIRNKKFKADGFAKLVTAALIMYWIRTLLEYYRGRLNNPKMDNKINRNLPVACYIPYESHDWPGYHIALLNEIFLVMQSYFIVLGHDCSFICFSEEILHELNVVAITLRDLEDRSDHLLTELGNKISCDESVRLCLRHSVQHHQKVIKLFNAFQEYAYWNLFINLSGGALLLCLSALMLTSDKISFEDKCVTVAFLGNELFHFFIFCYYGELFITKCADLGDSLYRSSWIGMSKTVKPYLILVKLRTQNPLTLKAGFMTADFKTYSDVLRGAYSYLNLLQATSH